MNIYIKCSSRPFYLDRLLQSIEINCNGARKIVLLNDGIAAQHIEKLARGRGFEERRSARLISNQAADPGVFWAREVALEGREYAMVLEEDTWITSPIDLDSLERNLSSNLAIMMRMYWLGSEDLTRAAQIQFRTKNSDGNILEFYSKVDMKNDLDPYNYFCVAHGIFRADYYADTLMGAAHWADEAGLLRSAFRFINDAVNKGERFRMCKSGVELLRHCTTTTSRADSGGAEVIHKIDARQINAALNEAWEQDSLNVMEGYPLDIPEQVIVNALGDRLGPAAVEQWRLWRRDYIDMYESMGAKL